MKNHNVSSSNRVWFYAVILCILFVVLVFLVVKKGRISPSLPVLQNVPIQSAQERLKEKSITPVEGDRITGSTGRIVPKQDASQEAQQQTEGKSPNGSTPASNTSSSYARLGCFVENQQSCTIKKNDKIYSILGQNPDAELLVNGVKIRPEKIIFQTSSQVYTDEQIKDGQGKVLTSTNKSYNSDTNTLTLSIGANPTYYSNLKPTEQRLLYLSQTVRSFMAMFGETPENFVKVERVVNDLGSWQPTP